MDPLTSTFSPATTKLLQGAVSKKVNGPTIANKPIMMPAFFTTTAGSTKAVADKSTPSTFKTISSNLSKPIGLVAQSAEDIGTAIGTRDLSYLKNTPAHLGGILSGSRTNSFTDIYRKQLIPLGVNPTVATAAGLFVDIFADPLNLIGGGLTKGGELASKVSALRKAGIAISKDSKMAKEIAKLGLTADDLVLGGSKAAQAQAGQRALLKLSAFGLEVPLIKGDSVYSKAKLTNQVFKTGKVGSFINKVFNTKTSNEAFNTVKTNFDNLYDYRKSKVMEEATGLQKEIAGLTQEEALRVVDAVETGVKSGNTIIDTLAGRLKTNFTTLKNEEKKLGLLGSEIQDYFPHIKVKEDKPITDRLLDLFRSPKKYSTALGSSKEREIIRFVKEGFTDKKGLVGQAEKLGLRKLNTEKLISVTEEQTTRQTKALQELQAKLARPEIELGTEDLRQTIKELRQHVSRTDSSLTEALKEPSLNEYQDAIHNIVDLERSRLEDLIKTLEENVLTSQGKEHLKGPVNLEASREAKIVDLQRKIVAVENAAAEKIKKLQFFDYVDKEGNFFKGIKQGTEVPGIGKATVNEINEMFGTDFFQNKPAVAYAERALGSARAVTAKEFFESVKPFAQTTDDAVEVAAKELAGLKFAPDVAAGIDDYYKKVKPEELNMFLKMFDTVQNWWKAQALVAPSYHVRNEVGNVWNNFLAGVSNPGDYADALKLQRGKMVNFVDNAGQKWDTPQIIDEAQRHGVINEGWYANDIETAIGNGLDGTTWNPLKQNFKLFQYNKQAGTAIENNARLAHFVAKLKEGQTAENAAASVKKYLFDYADLTTTEKTIFKRLVPFYTWTRKNIPLQLEALFTQPGKFSQIGKTINAIESNVEKPNEKYLGSYIKDNVGVRYKQDDRGNTFYFLLGNWLPAAQAIDFLSQPFENTIQALTPFAKTPVELWSNQSTFFEDNFGNPQPIERYPLENQTFLGLTMRKKTVNVLKNVRLLNELDKLNPGGVWGTDKTPGVLSQLAPGTGVTLPVVGPIATAGKQQGRNTPQIGGIDRLSNLFLGKSVPYKPSQAKRFYQLDKQSQLTELKKSLTNARKEGQKDYAKLIIKKIKELQKQ